jgi:hypothetical protein
LAERDPGIASGEGTRRSGIGFPVPELPQATCKGDNPAHEKHGKVWKLEGFPLESLLLSSHIGPAARKAGSGGSGGVSFRRPLGDRQFRAFAVRDEMVLTGGRAFAPRTSFCVLVV